MSFYDESDDEEPIREPGQSACGIFSLLLAVVALIGSAISLGYAIWLEENTPNGADGLPDDAPEIIMVGLGIFASGGAAFLGGILALISLMNKDSKHGFAIAGIILNGLIILGICGLMVLGLLAG